MREDALSIFIHERRVLSRCYPSNTFFIDLDLVGYYPEYLLSQFVQVGREAGTYE